MNTDDPHGQARRAHLLRVLFSCELVAWVAGLVVAGSSYAERGPLPDHVETIWIVVLATFVLLIVSSLIRLFIGRGLISGLLFRDRPGLQALTVVGRMMTLCPFMALVTMLTSAGWHA